MHKKTPFLKGDFLVDPKHSVNQNQCDDVNEPENNWAEDEHQNCKHDTKSVAF